MVGSKIEINLGNGQKDLIVAAYYTAS